MRKNEFMARAVFNSMHLKLFLKTRNGREISEPMTIHINKDKQTLFYKQADHSYITHFLKLAK